MSIAIKFFLLFLLVGLSTAKYLPAHVFELISANQQLALGYPLRKPNKSEIKYFDRFILKMECLQLEADKKYPPWKSTNYLDRSLFLLKGAQAYVQLWYNRRKYHNMGNHTVTCGTMFKVTCGQCTIIIVINPRVQVS